MRSPALRATILASGVLAALLSVGSSACHSVRRTKTQEEIGPTHVAVVSVAHWEDYVDSLQPVFKLTAEDALKRAVPTTSKEEQRLLDVLQSTIKIAPPTSTRTVEEISKTGEKPKNTTTEQSKPGDLASVPVGASLADGKSAGALAGFPAEGELGTDPLMQYAAGASLYQEVQLLNRYVRDAARRRGCAPYVVRMQVSLMPRTRDEAYDTWTNLSFFSGKDPIETGRGMLGGGKRSVGSLSPPEDGAPAGEPYVSRYESPNLPDVIPLLVTDALEGNLHARSEETLRKYVLALGLMIHGFGGQSEMQRFRDAVDKNLGRDYNSLLTVGRVSHNSIRVRFGAVRKDSDTFTMIPQTHNVTFLLLVPPAADSKFPEQVHVVGRTTYVRTSDGKEARIGEDHEWKRDLDGQGDAYDWTGDMSVEDVRRLMFWVRDDMYPEYVKELDSIVRKSVLPRRQERLKQTTPPKDLAVVIASDTAKVWAEVRDDQDSVWADLVSFQGGSRFTYVRFDLPLPLKPALPEQTVVLKDDGKQAVAVLRGCRDLRAQRTRARLRVEEKDATPPGFLEIYGEVKEIGDNGRTLVLAFPSLTGMGLKREAPEPKPDAPKGDSNGAKPKIHQVSELTVELDNQQDDWGAPAEPSFQAALMEQDSSTIPGRTFNSVVWVTPQPEKVAPGFSLTAGAHALIPDKDGRATVLLYWTLKDPDAKPDPKADPKADRVFLTSDGADIVSLEGKPPTMVALDNGRWIVSENGVMVVSLSNLAPGTRVLLKAAKEKGVPIVLEYEVRQGASQGQPSK